MIILLIEDMEDNGTPFRDFRPFDVGMLIATWVVLDRTYLFGNVLSEVCWLNAAFFWHSLSQLTSLLTYV